MRIQTLCELGWGYKKIHASYPEKSWKLCTVKAICCRFNFTGSAVDRKFGNGRSKSARTTRNIDNVAELICAQDDHPDTSKSTREIANEDGISKSSNIAKKDLALHCCKCTPAQVLSADTK